MEDFVGRVERDGFAIVPHAVPSAEIEGLAAAIGSAITVHAERRRGGLRNLFDHVPAVRNLARSPHVRGWAAGVLGPDCFAVRALLFDKNAAANWSVPWHQDVAIAVKERIDVPGFSAWSVKNGVVHVHPPAGVLQRMLAVRVHLDDCGPENGALRVLPGSHRAGRLSDAGVSAWQDSTGPAECCVARGGLLVMRPLLLHASSRISSSAARRVVHLEYAADPLPGGLEWHERW
jgi:hypothetical protein